jgi:hypothetical protein
MYELWWFRFASHIAAFIGADWLSDYLDLICAVFIEDGVVYASAEAEGRLRIFQVS